MATTRRRASWVRTVRRSSPEKRGKMLLQTAGDCPYPQRVSNACHLKRCKATASSPLQILKQLRRGLGEIRKCPQQAGLRTQDIGFKMSESDSARTCTADSTEVWNDSCLTTLLSNAEIPFKRRIKIGEKALKKSDEQQAHGTLTSSNSDSCDLMSAQCMTSICSLDTSSSMRMRYMQSKGYERQNNQHNIGVQSEKKTKT
jgi:hypothetical protein